jgi:nucleoside-diphosphate-sugar epimerase
MKILFTGASSFTGMWFSKALAEAGCKITAVFPRKLEEYQDLRRERVNMALKWCRPVYSCPFGSEAFLKLIQSEPHWDMLCHHAADVYDYKNPNFDYAAALAKNTKNLNEVLSLLKDKGCKKILLTGSVFEQGEGEGSDLLRAVSPYGLSKGLTSDVFKYYCQTIRLKLGKFVIPNPFGPYEEPRFTTYLIKSWYEGKTPTVSSPDYVRDNIPVTLLAKAYQKFAENLSSESGYQQCNPSFYACNQGEFTLRFAKEMEKRLSIPCKVELQKQKEFQEPQIRINSERLNDKELNWDEKKAWDELATYYKSKYAVHDTKKHCCSCH